MIIADTLFLVVARGHFVVTGSLSVDVCPEDETRYGAACAKSASLLAPASAGWLLPAISSMFDT